VSLAPSAEDLIFGEHRRRLVVLAAPAMSGQDTWTRMSGQDTWTRNADLAKFSDVRLWRDNPPSKKTVKNTAGMKRKHYIRDESRTKVRFY